MRIDPRDAEATHRCCCRHFGEMEFAYRRCGGIVSDGNVVLMLRKCSDQPISQLARWIVARDVVNFACHGTTWLPMFQFEKETPSLVPAVTAVMQELTDVFDDWELAAWFGHPNAWLRGMTPADAVTAYPSAVHDAARADRFIARG